MGVASVMLAIITYGPIKVNGLCEFLCKAPYVRVYVFRAHRSDPRERLRTVKDFRVLTAVTASNSTVFLDVVPFIVGTVLLRVREKLTRSVFEIVNLEDENSRLLQNVCQFKTNYTSIKFKKTLRCLFRV